MPNYKQLCTDLLAALKSWSPGGGAPLEGPELERETALIARAEAALASDEHSPPSTDEMFYITPETLAQAYLLPALAAYKRAYENSQKAGLAPWPKHHDAGIEAVLILALDRSANAADASLASACREWIKGCTCAPASAPQECTECTEGFLQAVLTRARKHGLEIGINALPTTRSHD